MKKLVVIPILILLSSCSLPPNKDAASEIKQQEDLAINRIKEEADRVVSDATTHIEAEITNAIGKADNTLKNAIESAQSTIKATVSAEIKKQSAELKKEKNSEIRKAKMVGLLGVLFGLISFATAIYALIKRKSNRIEHISTGLFIEKLENPRVKKALDAALTDSTLARDVRSFRSEYATKREINEIRTKIGATSERHETTYIQAESRSKPVQRSTYDMSRTEPQNVADPTQHVGPSIYELYANETSNLVISEVYEKYQPGYSIYRLILKRPDSTTAEIELCTDHDDAKRRITKNDDTLLSSICDIKRISEEPKEVVILNKGSVEKIGKSEWKVVKKITVELR